MSCDYHVTKQQLYDVMWLFGLNLLLLLSLAQIFNDCELLVWSHCLRVGESFTVRGTQEEKRYELDVIIAPLPPGVERTVPEGTVAVYNCNRGYSRRGNNMGACVAGHWMGDLPTCTGECACVSVEW